MTPLTFFVLISLAAWAWLLTMRGGFWRADQRLGAAPAPKAWPSVVCVIPARDEAASIAQTVQGVLAQDYPGVLQLIVIDDHSSDGTAEVARAAAGDDSRLQVISGAPLQTGWTGKLWAQSQGIQAAGAADYLWLTDADIRHAPDTLVRLVCKAEAEGLVLVSLMVKLRCVSIWERLLIPAFVFFFQKLYPFRWAADPKHRTAAAAGGCMLVKRAALAAAGGTQAIKDHVIDDCALAALIKGTGGRIWLGLSEHERSLRAYDQLGDIWSMVARTAFIQLDHSALNLLGTVVGMVLLYVLPTIAILPNGEPITFIAGAMTLVLMMTAYLPTLRLYGAHPVWAVTLPFAGLLYTLMTVDSARRHWQGVGNAWKGRTYEE